MSSINKNSESYRNAQLSNLIYSNTFDAGIVRNNDGSDRLFDQFFTKDKDGNVVYRNEVKQEMRDYIGGPNSDVASMMRDYKVLDVRSNHATGYQGIALQPTGSDQQGQAIFVNRGTEPSSIIGDVFNDLMIGTKTYTGLGGETSQMDDARAFANNVLDKFKITEVSTVGHSLGGAIATTQASNIIAEHPEVTVKKVETYNAPQVKEVLKQQGREDTFEKLGEVTTSNIISNDLVHRAGDIEGNYQPVSGLNTIEGVGTFTSDNVIGKVKIFSSVYEDSIANGFTSNHSIMTFLEDNKSSFNMSYTNEDGSLNIDSIRSAYSELENKVAIAQQEVDSAGYMDYVSSFFREDNPYNRLEQAKTRLEEFNRLLDPYKRADGNMAFVEDSQDVISNAEQTVVDSLGSENNKKLLDAVVDSIKLQETPEAQEQFIALLQSSDLIDSLFGLETAEAQTLDSIISDKFTQANTQQYGDPLVVDLDGDGIETIGADGNVLFDHDADGQSTGTGWTNADDGLLVRDLDNSGTINNGQELFGDNTIKADGTKAIDGFDALSDLDSNSDGVFDANDSDFDSVQVWQDKDQDGVTDQGELLSLAEAGISSIDLNAQDANQNIDGGILKKISTATNTDGSSSAVGAMDFAENKFYSEFSDTLEISEGLQSSINVAGQGALRSLHEAASLSPELNTLLQDLYLGNTAITDSSVHEVLLEWAKSAENFTTSLELLDGITLDDGTEIIAGIGDGTKTVLERTAILEAINGERLLDYTINDKGDYYDVYVRTGSEISDFGGGMETVTKGGSVTLDNWNFHALTDNGRTTLINDAYTSTFDSIKDSIKTTFMVNEIQPMLLENISFELDASEEIALNFDGVNETIVNKLKADPVSGLNFLSEVVKTRENTLLSDGWNVAVLSESIKDAMPDLSLTVDGKNLIVDSLGDDSITGTSGNDYILASEGDDYINAGHGSDSIYGGEGNDTLVTENGSGNYLEGGKGNDTLLTGKASYATVYKYNLGDGFDTISRSSTKSVTGEYNHKVLFGEGINQEDLSYFRQGNDLIIQVGDDPSQGVNLKNYYHESYAYKSKVTGIEFTDGEVFNISDLRVTTLGTDSDDLIEGTKTNDSLMGLAGNDTINAGNGNDIVYGGSGDDYINGGYGSDSLYGGEGNDTLVATSGSNNYFEGGKGDDTLSTGYASYSAVYKYNLGDGFDTVTRSSTRSQSTEYNHKVLFGEGINQEDLSYFRKENDLIIQVGDDPNQGVNLKNYYHDSRAYQSKVSSIEFADGSHVDPDNVKLGIMGTDESDTLIGDSSSDNIVGNGGNDTIIGGSGDDVLEGGAGADTYVINANDTGTKTINMSSNDESIDIIRLEGVDSSNVEFEVQDKDLAILLKDDKQDLISKVMVDDYYTQTGETTDNFQIEIDDATTDIPNFGEKLRQIKAEMMEALEKSAADTDGGAINGNQVSTNMDSSGIMDIWIPKKPEGS